MNLDKLDLAIASLTLAVSDHDNWPPSEIRDLAAALHSIAQARMVLREDPPFVDGDLALPLTAAADRARGAELLAKSGDYWPSDLDPGAVAGFIHVMKSPGPETLDRPLLRAKDIEAAVFHEVALGTLRFTAEGAERIHVAARAIADGWLTHQPKASDADT